MSIPTNEDCQLELDERVLTSCIVELRRLDPADRERVLRTLHAFFGDWPLS